MDDTPDQQQNRLTWEAISFDVGPTTGHLDTLIELVRQRRLTPQPGDLAEAVIVF